MRKVSVNYFCDYRFPRIACECGRVVKYMGILNGILGVFERRGHYEMIEKLGLYWHFVDLVWVFVFLAFYLL